jgi:hypothetical protein
VGANSYFGISRFLEKERNPSFVGVQEPDGSSRHCLDLVIIEIITRGWNGDEDVKIEHGHHVRIDTVDKRLVGIENERIDFLRLVIPDDTKYSSETGS